MSTKDKTSHPTNRRIAAVSFLNNISLNGSYKDSCWQHESRQDPPERSGDFVSNSNHFICMNDIFKDLQSPETEDDRTLSSAERQRTVTLVCGGDVIHPPTARVRSNTGSFCRTNHYTDGYTSHTKHAHFSSSESLDHGKAPHSAGNISDMSIRHQNTTIVNLKTDSIPAIKNERLVILVSHRTPLVVFSALPYTRDNRVNRIVDRPELIRRTRNVSGSRPISTLSDTDPLEQLVHYREEEVSYGHLLKPTKEFHAVDHGGNGCDEIDFGKHRTAPRCYSYEVGGAIPSSGPNPENSPSPEIESPDQRGLGQTSFGSQRSNSSTYSPHMLDDPEFRAGKHRTLLTFPSYITSVIDYCKASDMKKELNDKFKDRFPHIHLTLSKLRSLKRDIRRVAKAECNVDLLTVAQAYVYFEKLILRTFVTKYNRKYCAGACLLISAKLNDVKGYYLHNLLEMIERTFRVNRRDLLSFEFAVLVALEFTLHLPAWEVFPHYQRLLYES